jgi:hypothetical protein
LVIYGLDYPSVPMGPAVEAFETLASCWVGLGSRDVSHYADLIRRIAFVV